MNINKDTTHRIAQSAHSVRSSLWMGSSISPKSQKTKLLVLVTNPDWILGHVYRICLHLLEISRTKLWIFGRQNIIFPIKQSKYFSWLPCIPTCFFFNFQPACLYRIHHLNHSIFFFYSSLHLQVFYHWILPLIFSLLNNLYSILYSGCFMVEWSCSKSQSTNHNFSKKLTFYSSALPWLSLFSL